MPPIDAVPTTPAGTCPSDDQRHITRPDIVAILSGKGLNALKDIIPSSLTFGAIGTEKSLSFCLPFAVPVSGQPSLICFFENQKTGFTSASKTGKLMGKTTGGLTIQGSEAIRIVR